MNKNIIIILAIAFLILLAPLALRYMNQNSPPWGGETFHNMKLTKSLLEDSEKDSFEKESLNIYHYFLAGLTSIMPFDTLVKILPIVLGLVSVFLIYKIIQRTNLEEKRHVYIMGLFILSPIFVYLFSSLNQISFIVFLNLLAIYLFLTRLYHFSSIFMILTVFIDFFAFLASIFLLFVLAFSTKKLRQYIIMLIITMLLFLAKIMLIPEASLNIITNPANLSNIITDFGAHIGYSTFLILLFMIGFIIYWKKQGIVIDLIIAAAFIFSLYNSMFRVYMNFIFCLYAGILLHNLMKRRWSLNLLKKITMILIFCSLVFSLTVYLNTVSNSEPSPGMVKTIEALKLSRPGEKVLSLPEYSEFIEYYSSRKAVLNSESNETVLNEATQILYSRDLKQTAELLDKFNIKYILITGEMKQGRIWEKEDQGLLFLLDNSEKFINIYKYNSYELYQYVGV